jgi:hypothetical protein
MSTILLKIPPKALVNIKTLLPHYRLDSKRGPLSATQMVSLHLGKYRPCNGQPSGCSTFGSYISVLPTEFDGHPLTWLIREDVVGKRLLPTMTSTARRLLDGLHDRFRKDLAAIRGFQERRAEPAVDLGDFLWGWLNGEHCYTPLNWLHRVTQPYHSQHPMLLSPTKGFQIRY